MVKKSNEKWLWFAGGFIIAYVLHGQIQGVVGQLKGAVGMRSRAYHVTPRAGSRWRNYY
jgi:hypothetical protein